MKILSSYESGDIITSPHILTERMINSVYLMSDRLISCVAEKLSDKDNVILFSGSWRFNFNATFIEHKGFQGATIDFHTNTLFVNPDTPLIKYTLGKLNPKVIAILHSGTFLKYRKISDIMYDLSTLKHFIQPHGKVIATLPIDRVNFNRLTTSITQLTSDLSAEYIDNALIITL